MMRFNPFSKQNRLKKILSDRPQIKVFSLSNIGELEAICDNLVADQIYVDDQYPVRHVLPDELWAKPVIEERRWQFRLQSFITVELLLNGYDQLGKEEYLHKAIEMAKGWARHHFPESSSPLAWHDHSTALRLIVISKLFEVWRQTEWDGRFAVDVCDWVTAHAEKLMDDSFYMAEHNHGLDQDMALYVAAVVFDFLPEAEVWRETALNRFWKQMDHLFAEDGSYREHSPQYTLIFVERLLKFAHFLKERDEQAVERLLNQIKQQMRFLTYILQPDGQLPALGDTITQPTERPLHHPPEEEYAALAYVAQRGETGRPPAESDALFPAGGYAVFRNKWPYDQETMQVTFYSSFHSRVHKHRDDLAITLFGHGQPLLIDGGQYKYDYERPERKYVVSNRAHNSVIVDGQETETIRLNIGKSGLTDYYSGEALSFAAGAHCLYPGVIHRRLIFVIKPFDTLILDWVSGYKEHHFEQHFLFHPNLECQLHGREVWALREDERLLTIRPLLWGEALQTDLVRGESEPQKDAVSGEETHGEKEDREAIPVRGWCSLKYGQLEPAWSASFSSRGRDARLAAHLVMHTADGSQRSETIADFRWEHDRITFRAREASGRERVITLMVGLRHHYLSVDGKLVEMQHVAQPVLWKAMEEAARYEFREKYRQERERRLRWQHEAERLKEKLDEMTES